MLRLPELMSSFGADPSRESLRATRFPVSLEEFKKLKAKAGTAKPTATKITNVYVQEDKTIKEQETQMVEKPEFDSTLEQSLAPGIIASFKGIPQTAWMPPDSYNCG